jgi:hypothetical protein
MATPSVRVMKAPALNSRCSQACRQVPLQRRRVGQQRCVDTCATLCKPFLAFGELVVDLGNQRDG